MKTKGGSRYSGVVWLISGFSLVAYGITGLLNTGIPGVEELVSFLSSIENTYIYLAAFISIFIEGLYVVGSFFPGSTLVVILAVLSQIGGLSVFLTTILVIFFGWCLAGAINIFGAKVYRSYVTNISHETPYVVKDRPWTTWFPAFRANYEVSQVVEGGKPFLVLLSSIRVKFFASLAAASYVLILPFFIDIQHMSNKEGFLSIAIVAVITIAIGTIKLFGLSQRMSQRRWHILNREGLSMKESELPPRPGDARKVGEGGVFTPWYKLDEHVHVVNGRIDGIHAKGELPEVQKILMEILRHEEEILINFGREEDILLSDVLTFLKGER